MIDYDVIRVDLSVAHTGPGFEVQVDHEKIVILEVDNTAVDARFSIDKPAGNPKDEIPALAASEFCASEGSRIGKIYVLNTAGAAGEELVIVGVSDGNITFYG